MSKKFKVVTLGCRTNQYESQAYVDQLKSRGYIQAEKGEEPEFCIVNTCTVTESADSSSRHAVRQLVRESPNAKIVVTGCAAEKEMQAYKQIEGVSHVEPNKTKEKLLTSLFPRESWPEFSIKNFEAHTRAFVKVQDGCNSFCTYCIIPYVRGRSRSRRLEDILDEVRSLVSSGFREIVLTGINIGDFDGAPKAGEKPVRLADLVRAVDEVVGVERLRISSIDPDEVDDDLIDAVLLGKNTCPSFHIVLQSGSNVVLKRMNRKYTVQMFLEAIDKIRKACLNFTFTTDVIVGFPGETESDFEDTLKLMRSICFAKVHMFPYSSRGRTRAHLYTNKISQVVIQERKKRLLEVAQETSFHLREGYVGKEMKVLLESPVKGFPHLYSGYSENFLPVWVEGDALRSNEIVLVKILENTEETLKGKVV